MSSPRSDGIKFSVFAVVAVVITISMIATLLDLKSFSLLGFSVGQSARSYHAVFANASDLQAGDTVRIAGVEVGKVSSVKLNRADQAVVDFTVASSQQLTSKVRTSIEFENLLGQRYLQVSETGPGGTPLRSGATIPLADTTPGLDLTSVFTGFQPLLAALNPTQVNELTGSIIAVLQGESGSVSDLLTQTATLTTNLASRQRVIDEVIDNLTPLMSSVNSEDSQIAQLVDGLDTLVHGMAGQRQQLGQAVTSLANLTTTASHLLDQAQPVLDHDLTGLENVTSMLTANENRLDKQLSKALQGAPGLLNALDKASSSGNYLSIYVCDLTLAISNPISVKLSAGVPQSPPLSPPAGVIGNPSTHSSVCALPGGTR